MFCGVTQCSVLEPLLFTLYATTLRFLIDNDKLDLQLYADDTQVYKSLSTGDKDHSLTQLGDGLGEISSWMTNTRRRFNAARQISLS